MVQTLPLFYGGLPIVLASINPSLTVAMIQFPCVSCLKALNTTIFVGSNFFVLMFPMLAAFAGETSIRKLVTTLMIRTFQMLPCLSELARMPL
jgi:hypothetical protein